MRQAESLLCVQTDYGLVSVIMPNYNSEKYLRDTIKSVIDQTYTNWELIFVDDCSTDNSIAVVREFNDDRIKIFQNEKNSGAAVTRNHAIEEASGKWMAFLDSDDIWLPEKLQKQLTYMSENGYDFTFSSYSVIDDKNEIISVFNHKKDSYYYSDLLKHNYIGCLTSVYNAESLGKVFMPTNTIKREDLACWLSILRDGTVAHCLHERLAKYKVHSNSVSSNKLKMVRCQWHVYRKVEKLNLLKSAYYMMHWIVLGLIKYR